MREWRIFLTAAGTALAAGCGSSGVPANAVTLTPTAGIESVMECLTQEAGKLGYKVLRVDREGGFMEAERRDRDPAIRDPREYAGGDRLEVSQVKADGDARPLAIKPSSFIMEWLVNGANMKQVPTTDRAKGDAQTLSDRCRL